MCDKNKKIISWAEFALEINAGYKQEWENSFESAVGAVFDPETIAAAFGRVSESEAWDDLFGGGMPAPDIVDAKTIEW